MAPLNENYGIRVEFPVRSSPRTAFFGYYQCIGFNCFQQGRVHSLRLHSQTLLYETLL